MPVPDAFRSPTAVTAYISAALAAGALILSEWSVHTSAELLPNVTMLVGGVDSEMVDPRLNEDILQRVARASGGAVIAAGDTQALLARLDAAAPASLLSRRRDLWHAGWSFALLAAFLAAEWLLRRASGLR